MRPLNFPAIACTLIAGSLPLKAEHWQPDLENGNYQNPVIFADYSDPDIVKVGDDFYMTASSFNSVPALPILHSRDLVNWKLVNYAVRSFPDDHYDIPQHGNGVWAPSFRFQDGWYYIYWGDPDRGIFRVKTQDPLGTWETPTQVSTAYGNIDSCPLWDDDGKVYLVHAFANSRAGVKSILQVAEMKSDGSELTSNKRVVFMGYDHHATIEGPKFIKRNGYYYIFAPGGGVPTGWQTILRSRDVWGPYEDKIVLAQGNTDINGPHQGGYVELDNGEGWFVHFQELQPYGRIVHLQPVHWVDDWPVMGDDADGDGCGEPFKQHKKPSLPLQSIQIPQTGDEFDESELSLAWQWQAQPRTGWYTLENNQLRLNAVYPLQKHLNLWTVPQLLLQKLPAPAFSTETLLDPTHLLPGERSGLVMMGLKYATVTVSRESDETLKLSYSKCEDAMGAKPEISLESVNLPGNSSSIYMRCHVQKGGLCTFSWSSDGETYHTFHQTFQAVEGRWIGAKVGIFVEKDKAIGERGWVDFDYFRIE